MAALTEPDTLTAPSLAAPFGSLAALARQEAGEGAFSAGMAQAASVLWTAFHSFDAADPTWPDRDRLVLSDPDGAALLGAVRDLTGSGADPADLAPGLPGAGLAAGVGLALAERVMAARFGKSLVDHRTWVLASADELLAGPAFEAACLAGWLRLDRLTVLLHAPRADEGSLRRFAALGWATRHVPATDTARIADALVQARRSRKPTLIALTGAACDGVPDKDAAARWHEAGTRGATARRAWLKRLTRHPQRAEFERVIAGRLTETCLDTLAGLRATLAETGLGTTEAGRRVVAACAPMLPELLAGVCRDLAPSLELGPRWISADDFAPRTLDFGARIGAMMAAMTGLAAHGGIAPCGVVSLAATDLLRPALRQAAMVGLRTVLLARGSESGGPSWQAIEQLAALRAVPNLLVLRPADAVEVAECWEIALRRTEGPSVVVLGPDLPTAPRRPVAENRSARGGYVLAEANGPRQATLIATGNEVAIAMDARALLEADGIAVAVASLPAWDLFGQADAASRAAVLGPAGAQVPRFGIEAGCGFGWERWLGPDGTFIGITSFAAAAAGLGITAEAVATAVRKRLSQGPSS